MEDAEDDFYPDPAHGEDERRGLGEEKQQNFTFEPVG